MLTEVTALFILLNLPIELLIAALLFIRPLRHRSHWKSRVLLFFAGLFGVAFLNGKLLEYGLYSAEKVPQITVVLAYSALSFCIVIIFVWWVCEIPLKEALYCATAAYLTQHMTYCLHCFFCPDAEVSTAEGYDLAYVLTYMLIYGAVYVLIARPLARMGHQKINLTQSLFTMISALIIVLALSAGVQQQRAPHAPLYRFCLLYAVFGCFYVLWEQVSQQKQLALQHELDLQQQLWNRHRAQYERSAESVDIINRKCHDLKHQIAAFRQLSSGEQQKDALREMEETVSVYDSMVETGNDILDTILTEKSLFCETRGIVLTCVADGACLAFLDAVDLYTMIGNALDNAVEGVERLSDPEKKLITVRIFSGAGIAIVEVENYYEGCLTFEDGLPVTEKEEKGYHGFGLKSIRHTAEKYGGFLAIHTAESIFLLRITIPLHGPEREAAA